MGEWFGALDLKSGSPWFESTNLPLSGFVLGSPECNSSIALCKLVSLQPVGILNRLCSIRNICLFIYSIIN